MKIAICDDERIALPILEKTIRIEFQKQQVFPEFSLFQSGLALRQAVFSGIRFDVLFLDIDMPDADGIDLACHIRESCKDTLLIFVSNMEHYVFRSFLAQPFRFIRKSHFKEEIHGAVCAVLQVIHAPLASSILIETSRQTLQLNPLTIQYVECNRKQLRIVTEAEEHTITYKISDIEKQLKEYGFIRIHKGYLVNYRYIFSINKEDLTLDNQTILPVSRMRMADVRSEFRRLTL